MWNNHHCDRSEAIKNFIYRIWITSSDFVLLAITKLLKFPIHFYRIVISPWLGRSCRFQPTCSTYALQALEKHGPFKGLALFLKRFIKCHPFCHCEYNDPVPERIAWSEIIGYKRRCK